MVFINQNINFLLSPTVLQKQVISMPKHLSCKERWGPLKIRKSSEIKGGGQEMAVMSS